MNNDSYIQRLSDVQRFYELLNQLETKLGGMRTLFASHGRMDWPRRGVYFFFEPGEARKTSGNGLRVVRIGTHALKEGGNQSFWKRLSNHQGYIKSGGGNHRGSIFRLHIGSALINKGGWPDDVSKVWEGDRHGSATTRLLEEPLEKAVSDYIRAMPFLWLDIDDEPGPSSLRGFVERNSIALLSNFNFRIEQIDPPSENWLGNWSQREVIRKSGLWNVNHIAEHYDRGLLEILRKLVRGLTYDRNHLL